MTVVSAHHRLELEHRGAEHIHVWHPRCCCGWVGVQRRRRKEAEQQYRDHVRAVSFVARRPRQNGARAVTPVADLPEALQ